MLTIITGATGAGKTTLAAQLARETGATVVSAGSWIRDLTGCAEHSPRAAAFLAEQSARKLAADPLIAARTLADAVGRGRIPVGATAHVRDYVLEGVRNPTDLLHLLRPGDRVIDLGGVGASPWERTGLDAIRALRPWAEQMDVAWEIREGRAGFGPRRYFAPLPAPIPCHVARRWLTGGAASSAPGWEPGEVIAIEAYPGAPYTVAFRGASGGVFHDLPIEAVALGTMPDHHTYQLPRGGQVYAPAKDTTPVFEPAPSSLGLCWVYDRDRTRLGQGETIGMIHHPEGNELYHLVDLGGRLLLWPPHKLLFTLDAAAELPDWRKMRPAEPVRLLNPQPRLLG